MMHTLDQLRCNPYFVVVNRAQFLLLFTYSIIIMKFLLVECQRPGVGSMVTLMDVTIVDIFTVE